MKKILFLVVLTLISIFGTACNKQVFDLNYKFNYALIKIGDDWIEYEIDTWKDYDDSEQLQIKLKDGTVILTNSFNCTLFYKKV